MINPSNLASWKLSYFNLPIHKVKNIVLTRFSMAFVEFIVAEREEYKVNCSLTVVTLDWIYEKIKKTLKQIFMWND